VSITTPLGFVSPAVCLLVHVRAIDSGVVACGCSRFLSINVVVTLVVLHGVDLIVHPNDLLDELVDLSKRGLVMSVEVQMLMLCACGVWAD
jgi:hypothetical protein